MMIQMGVRGKDLVQYLISLDAATSFHTYVTCCRPFEAARTTVSAIHTSPSQLCAVSEYKEQRPQKTASPPADSINTSLPQVLHASPSTANTAQEGALILMVLVPTVAVRVTGPGPLDAQPRKCKVAIAARLATTTGLSGLSVYISSMMTEADVTVIGIHHFELLQIPRRSLQPLPATTTITADESQMSPALRWFQATLKLGNKFCIAKIQVHEGIQTSLLSFCHCQELAIISLEFPKPILAVTNVNRCTELPLPATTSPSVAWDFFLCKFRNVLVSKADLYAAPLRKMVGRPMKIHLKDDAVHFAIHMPRPIPFAF
ncbi:hypothetical protein SK128_023809 [Halocaridina rubra]|uniref:Uncharacterized protein n=1 Tax=Halocaridina rubra TaxID=373956 RepID=A0AAN8ZUN5_HALRR